MADKRLSMILTEQEQHVIALLAAAWNEFVKLPEQHPMHRQEFAGAIHQAQRLVMSRPVARALHAEQSADQQAYLRALGDAQSSHRS